MKSKYLIFWLFVLLFNNTIEAQKKSAVKKTTKTIKEVPDSLKNGTYKWYYKINGAIEREEQWKNGKKQGSHWIYFPNGKVFEYIEYTEGKKQGAYKQYDQNGNVIQSGFYTNDLEDKEWKYYFPNGNFQCP
jgi:antitoxin component YwqK of YwqJK toxin-antitoxin module